jgi:hypothetical protein
MILDLTQSGRFDGALFPCRRTVNRDKAIANVLEGCTDQIFRFNVSQLSNGRERSSRNGVLM